MPTAEITASSGAATSNSARLVVTEEAAIPAAPNDGGYESEVISLQHIASLQIRLDRLDIRTAHAVQWEAVVTGGTGSMADAKMATGSNRSLTVTNHGSNIVADPQITMAFLRIILLPSCHYTFAVRKLQIMNVHNEDGRDQMPRGAPFFDLWGNAPHSITGPGGADLTLSGSAPFPAYGNTYPRDTDVYVPLSLGSEMFLAGLAAGGDAGTASVSWTFSPAAR